MTRMTKDIDALSMSSVINAARVLGALDTSAEATSLRNYRRSIMSLNVSMVKCGAWVQEKYMETMKRDGGGRSGGSCSEENEAQGGVHA